MTCGPDEEYDAGLCYPKPLPGFHCDATHCRVSKDLSWMKLRSGCKDKFDTQEQCEAAFDGEKCVKRGKKYKKKCGPDSCDRIGRDWFLQGNRCVYREPGHPERPDPYATLASNINSRFRSHFDDPVENKWDGHEFELGPEGGGCLEGWDEVKIRTRADREVTPWE